MIISDLSISPTVIPSKMTSTVLALLSGASPICIWSSASMGTIRGRKDSVRGEIIFKTALLRVGCNKGPPADNEWPLEPAADDTINPSACKSKKKSNYTTAYDCSWKPKIIASNPEFKLWNSFASSRSMQQNFIQNISFLITQTDTQTLTLHQA